MARGTPGDPLDPNFLLEHAERLTTSVGRGRPPTIDAQRAASAAYYAAYHAATGEIARYLFGENWIHGVRWLSHRGVIDATRLVSRLGPVAAADPGRDPDRVRDHAVWRVFQELGGAGGDLLDTMEALRSLKVEREIADYDRTQVVSRHAARNLVEQAVAVKEFFESSRTEDEDTKTFFALAALKS